MTLIISHTGSYDFYWQSSAFMKRFHWGYLDVVLAHYPPGIAIPALAEAMSRAAMDGDDDG